MCFLVSTDEAGDKALKLLLSGATFYKDADGLRVYVKPGNEFEAAMEWYLMDLRNIIHYVRNNNDNNNNICLIMIKINVTSC